MTSLFESSEHEMKVPYDPDVYAVTCGGEHGEGDGCDKEGGGAGQEGHHGPEGEYIFKNSELGLKVLYNPDKYAVT